MRCRGHAHSLQLLDQGDGEDVLVLMDKRTGQPVLEFTKDSVVVEGKHVKLPTLVVI